MLSDASTLLIIAAASCVVVPWLICRSFPVVENNSRAIQNDTRQFANRDGRVASRPGSSRFAPGTGCAVSASGNDPSRGGTVRAFNDGD